MYSCRLCPAVHIPMMVKLFMQPFMTDDFSPRGNTKLKRRRLRICGDMSGIAANLLRCSNGSESHLGRWRRNIRHCSFSFRHNIFFLVFFTRAASPAVLTSSFSSGGGRTAGSPRDSIQSSRFHPMVWYKCSSSSSSTCS